MMRRMYLMLLTLILFLLSLTAFCAQTLRPIDGNDNLFNIVILTDGLEHPWSMAFLPDGRILVTERPGRLRIIEQGKLNLEPVSGLPKIAAVGQGGLMDIALHPQFKENGWIYFSYAAEGPDAKVGTEISRARLEGHHLRQWRVIFRMAPKTGSGRHFGSRLLFDHNNYLYISIGDRGERPRAQNLSDHAGSIIRLHDDGRIPDDNPYVAVKTARPEIFSYGHRNPQGMALHPETGQLWSNEHGPQGGDELNVIKKGVNYGWPVITYGVNYGTGTKIGEGSRKLGMQQPEYYWIPSIAPSGMSFYQGDKYPHWQGSLFLGSLKFQQLVRLEFDRRKVIREERFLSRKLGRVRDVRTGPDGYIYLLIDADNGSLVRLEPHD